MNKIALTIYFRYSKPPHNAYKENNNKLCNYLNF